jgi:hypothetical protein
MLVMSVLQTEAASPLCLLRLPNARARLRNHLQVAAAMITRHFVLTLAKGQGEPQEVDGLSMVPDSVCLSLTKR